jgi:hypothetical protein
MNAKVNFACKIHEPMENFLIAFLLAALFTGCGTANVSHYAGNAPVIYHNTQYGLTFSLPADWRGYTVLTNEWVGQQADEKTGEIIRTERGPKIILRHPQWTASDPHQDIPISIFTRAQWEDVREEKVFTSAGGIDFDVSHNRNYVFTVHSRFNWGELTGWEEAQKIVATNCMIAGPALYEK